MARKTIEIEHKKLGLKGGHVLPESLKVWLDGGWTPVDDGNDVEEPTLFDTKKKTAAKPVNKEF